MIKYDINKENGTVTAIISDSKEKIRENIFTKFKKYYQKNLSDNNEYFYPSRTVSDVSNRIKTESKNEDFHSTVLFIIKKLIDNFVNENKTFVGTATCFKEDKFNENIGISIARKKAILKSKHYYNKKINQIYKIIIIFMSFPLNNIIQNDKSLFITYEERCFCDLYNIDYKKIMGVIF